MQGSSLYQGGKVLRDEDEARKAQDTLGVLQQREELQTLPDL